MNAPTLLIRADASSAIGTGHVMRCLALAQAWQDGGGEVVFLCADLPPILEARLREEKCRVFRLEAAIGSKDDANLTAQIAGEHGAQWIVGDSYRFDFVWQSVVKKAGFSLLVLDDDRHAQKYAADVILNPNAGASAKIYRHSSPQSEILAGAEFALLRREFRLARQENLQVSPRITRILIAMGGADVQNLTPRTLRWLQSETDVEGKVHVAGLLGNLQDALQNSRFSLRQSRAGREMPTLMVQSDLVIGAAGSTTWELGFLGVPTILSVVAPNQTDVAKWAHENGVATNIGMPDAAWENRLGVAWVELQNDAARLAMARRGRAKFDGNGATRVLSRLWPQHLKLRPAHLADAQRLLEWRNDAATRAASFAGDLIEPETHRRWFAERLSSSQCVFLIAEVEGQAIGQVRFEMEAQAATISLSLAPDWRRRGWGATLIRAACCHVFSRCNLERIRALVKPENLSSICAFKRAGFIQAKERSLPDDALIFEINRA